MDLDARVILEPVGPAHRQIAEPRRLALEADRLVEHQRFGNRRLRPSGVGADLLELPDVVVLALPRGLQRPGLLDVLAADVEQARPVRGQQPLVEARALVVALKVAQIEREVCHGVCPVADRHEPACPCQAAEPLPVFERHLGLSDPRSGMTSVVMGADRSWPMHEPSIPQGVSCKERHTGPPEVHRRADVLLLLHYESPRARAV